MKTMRFVLFGLMGSLASILAGCATNQGGTVENEYSTGYGQGTSPAPMASPTFRPGMNPMDLRDSQGLTLPHPPPTTPPTAPPMSTSPPQ